MDSQYQAWNGETYQWPPPEGWEKRSDGRFWPPEQGPPGRESATPAPPPAPAPTPPAPVTEEPTSLLPKRSGPKAPNATGDNDSQNKKSSKGLIIGLILAGVFVAGIALVALVVSTTRSPDRLDGGVGAFDEVSLDQSTCVLDSSGTASVTMFVDNTTEVVSDYYIEVSFTGEGSQVATHESLLEDVQPKNRATIEVFSDQPLTGPGLTCQVTSAARKANE